MLRVAASPGSYGPRMLPGSYMLRVAASPGSYGPRMLPGSYMLRVAARPGSYGPRVLPGSYMLRVLPSAAPDAPGAFANPGSNGLRVLPRPYISGDANALAVVPVGARACILRNAAGDAVWGRLLYSPSTANGEAVRALLLGGFSMDMTGKVWACVYVYVCDQGHAFLYGTVVQMQPVHGVHMFHPAFQTEECVRSVPVVRGA
eukprot:1293398-Rhodomonas_salina.2